MKSQRLNPTDTAYPKVISMQVIFRLLEIPEGSGNSQSCDANFANTGSPGGFISIAISLRAIRHIKL